MARVTNETSATVDDDGLDLLENDDDSADENIGSALREI